MIQNLSSVRTRLMIVVTGGIGLLLLASAFTIYQLNSYLNAYHTTVNTLVQEQVTVNQMNFDFKVQVQEWKDVLLRGKDPEKYTKYWNQFESQHKKVEDNGAKLLRQIDNADTKDLIEKFLTAHQTAHEKYVSGVKTFAAADYLPSAGDKAVTGIDREPSKLLQQAADLIGDQVAEATQKIQKGSARIQTLAYVIVIGCSLIILWLLMSTLKKHFIEPLNHINNHLEKLAQGDFRNQLKLDEFEEWQRFNRHLNQMQDSLGDMIQAMRKSSNVLTQVAQEMVSNFGKIASQTQLTHQSTDQVAAAINEMSATVQEVARNASGAATAADEVDKAVNQGSQMMSSTISSIQRLSTEVEKVSVTMEQLESETVRIGGVLDVIKNVAEQTNLLALNAAIEAARAGEQGRGFAVVADEVRSLAKRTQESTAEIQQIIEAVQQGSSNAVTAMKMNRTQTAEASQLVSKAGDAIHTITQSVSQITSMNTQIATAAEEQSYAAEEINKNVTNVAGLVEQAAEIARNANQLVQALEQASSDLKQQVARFHL